LGLVPEVEDAALSLLNDEDHMVRAEAAAALAGCTSTRSREALLAAHDDRSPIVQEAARESLRQREEQAVYAENTS
jgi:HEAT repeat protein